MVALDVGGDPRPTSTYEGPPAGSANSPGGPLILDKDVSVAGEGTFLRGDSPICEAPRMWDPDPAPKFHRELSVAQRLPRARVHPDFERTLICQIQPAFWLSQPLSVFP